MVYLLFAGDSYYAGGGAMDLKGTYPSEAAALDAFRGMDGGQGTFEDAQYDWAHILDTDSLTVIEIRDGSYCGRLGQSEEDVFTIRPTA